MSCDVSEATEGLDNEQSLFLQPFRLFTYVTAHSPILMSLHLRQSSFSNPYVTSPTSQLILESSVASPMSQALHLRHLASHP